MATVIRMRRGGRTHKPYYRIVVQDSKARLRGPELDTLGVYHPCARPEPVSEVDVHKALEWLRKGAGMSDTARSVLGKLGVLKHFDAGTTPEEAVALAKDAAAEDKGYNAPPPQAEAPQEEAPKEEATEAQSDDSAPAEGEAAAGAAPEETTPAEGE